MLELENIGFSYADHVVLKGVSFAAHSGEFVAVLGANGAGKSTLVKIASGYIKPDSGKVLLNGRNINSYSPAELARTRAVCEQENVLDFDYSVLDTVCLGRFAMSGFWGVDSRTREIAQEALREVGLGGFENKSYLNLSGGEKRRVQLARVIAQILDSPAGRLLLLDEPTANLDPLHSRTTMQICKNLCARGACCVAVVHSVNLAMDFADKILMIKNNSLFRFGDTAEILTEENISALYQMPAKIVGGSPRRAVVLG